MKIRIVGAELFHADGQTGGYNEAKVAFRDFANVPKKCGPVTATQEDRSGISIPRSLHREYGNIM